jgi:hypothetical protein
LTPAARRRLTHLLIFKSIFELLLVAALAVGFHFVNFHSDFRGALDRADSRQASGWVIDASRPERPVEVQLYVDGSFAASARADRERRDVQQAGHAFDDWHGFLFQMPALPVGEHEARVYALQENHAGTRTPVLQLVGHPVRFRVEATETSMKGSAQKAGTESHLQKTETESPSLIDGAKEGDVRP